MAKQFILAHDLGTTGNKASLFDSQGKVKASAFYGYRTEYPHPNWVEQNPEDWWQAICISTRQLISTAKVNPSEIACIVFSGQMMGCVAVDRNAKPLRNAIIWADTRAGSEAQGLIDRVGMESTYKITGHRASASYSAAKIMWVRGHQPDLFAQAYKFLNAKDFIVARLTGRFVTDYSDASGMNLYDLYSKAWSSVMLNAIDLDPALLPEIHASTEVVGEVSGEIATDEFTSGRI
jgi:xylulokinase